MKRFVPLPCLLLLACLATPAVAQHELILQGNSQLVWLDRDGTIAWQMAWGGIHDLHLLPNGNVMVQRGAAEVVEIDPATKEVVWSYNSANENGNAGKPVEVHAFQPLGDGRLMIAESGPGRIIEIDRAGKLLHEVKLTVQRPSTHSDTRLARKLSSGNYLVAHENDGFVREYDSSGKVIWEFEVPLFGQPPKPGHGPEAFGNRVFAAERLTNGNTLVTTGNGHSVLEVTPDNRIVWKIEQKDLPNIQLAWVTTIEVLPNGNYLFGNCHAGPGQPLVIELDPQTKHVVWKLDRFAEFGNSVSNSRRVPEEAPR